MMRVSYHPGYFADIGEGHVFPMGKFPGLYAYLTSNGIIKEQHIVGPSPMMASQLSLVHTSRYLDAILNGNLHPKEERRLGLPWSESLARRSVLAAQGTLNAAMMALEDGIAGNLAGGTHHAFPDRGEGFCVFNDVAVAIRVLRQSLWVRRVMIIDCDVHQGNGTAEIFANEPDVFTFSMHGEKNYPFHKPPSDRDVGLPDGTGDLDYLDRLSAELEIIFAQFQPDIVFYLGGIDPLKDDRFGRLSLTLDGLRERERMVIRFVSDRDIPLVLLLSGGYAPTVEQTVEAHAQMFIEATLRNTTMT